MLLWLPIVRLAIHIGRDAVSSECSMPGRQSKRLQKNSAGRARKKDLVVKNQEQTKKQNHQKGAAQEKTRYFNFNAALAWMFGIGRELID